MVPKIATLICLALSAYLFWSDSKRDEGPSAASWIPYCWMFLAGSRWVSSWLSLSTPMASVDAYSEGSPVDRAVFLALILAGATVLARRALDWRRWAAANQWLVLYLAYCLMSMAWSDEPFVLFKRWIKDLGNPIMVLVLLTERRPYAAVTAVVRRLSFLLLPLSVLFVKYYPDLGRAYHLDGAPMYTGVGHQKNDLGALCLMTGMYFSWNFFVNRAPDWKASSIYMWQDLLLVMMMAYLLRMSDSQTSFACLVVATGLFVLSRIPPFTRKPAAMVGTVAVAGALFAVLEMMFHVKDFVFELLGRDSTLTSRTDLWVVVRRLESNPLVGTGFMSFWTGERMEKIWEYTGPGVNQAHNGYLEQYLNLGYIGVAFIGMLIVTALLSVRRQLAYDAGGGMLRFACLAVAILYNYTEASFYGISNLWVLFLLGYFTVPRHAGVAAVVAAAAAPSGPELRSLPSHRYRKPKAVPAKRPAS